MARKAERLAHGRVRPGDLAGFFKREDGPREVRERGREDVVLGLLDRQFAQPPDDEIRRAVDRARRHFEAAARAPAFKADLLIDDLGRLGGALRRAAEAKDLCRLGALLGEQPVDARRQAGEPHDPRLARQREIGGVRVDDDAVIAGDEARVGIAIEDAVGDRKAPEHFRSGELRGDGRRFSRDALHRRAREHHRRRRPERRDEKDERERADDGGEDDAGRAIGAGREDIGRRRSGDAKAAPQGADQRVLDQPPAFLHPRRRARLFLRPRAFFSRHHHRGDVVSAWRARRRSASLRFGGGNGVFGAQGFCGQGGGSRIKANETCDYGGVRQGWLHAKFLKLP